MEKIVISKLDAARRQLLLAIRLYFNHGDIVPMHTLAAAAFKITQNICDSSSDLPNPTTSWVEGMIKPEYKKEFWKKLHETANFFKHANNDPCSVHKFNPEQTEHIIFMTVYQYLSLTDDYSPEVKLFDIWYRAQHPKTFNPPTELNELVKEIFNSDRNIFWKQCLPVLQDQLDKVIIG